MDSLSELWDAVCTYVRTTGGITDSVFTLWIEPLFIDSFDGETVILGIESEFKFGIVEKKFNPLLEDAFFSVLGFPVTVEIRLIQKEAPEEAPRAAAVAAEAGDDLVINNPHNSFENFVVGKSNNYAYAAAKKVAENPGTAYNPLFIYGKSGLGKTHLLKAIENYMRSKNPDASIIYVTSEHLRTTSSSISAIPIPSPCGKNTAVRTRFWWTTSNSLPAKIRLKRNFSTRSTP